MPEAVAIQLDMPKPVAEALLSSLRCELRRGLTEHWYDDRYRTVPEFQRSRRIPIQVQRLHLGPLNLAGSH